MFVVVVYPFITGFVQTPESPGILLFKIPGLESLGKRHRSWKTMEILGTSWNSEAAFLDYFNSRFE